jgi:hypothetical protein
MEGVSVHNQFKGILGSCLRGKVCFVRESLEVGIAPFVKLRWADTKLLRRFGHAHPADYYQPSGCLLEFGAVTIFAHFQILRN